MLPKGWKKSQIGNHIDLLSGYAFRSEAYSDCPTDICLLRGDNIAPGYLRWREAKRWKHAESEALKKYHLHAGDLVIAMDRTWIADGLKIAEVKTHDIPCLLVQRVARIRAKMGFEQDLLKHIFSSHNFEMYVKGVQTETAVPHISSAQIKEFPVFVPPLMEQKKIAYILSTWDKAIEIVKKLVIKSQQQKAGLMQQLLTGKMRFSEFYGEWREVCFDEILHIEIGGTPSRSNPDYWDEKKITQNRWLSIRDLKESVINETKEYISDLGVLKSNASLIPAGSIVMSFKLTIGKTAILGKSCYTNEAICSLIPKNDDAISTEFLIQALNNVDLDKEIDQAIKGKTLNKAKLKRLKIKLPSLAEQEKITKILATADSEIEIHKYRLACLQQEKKALMQSLLTGKQRVTLEKKAA